MKLIKFFSPVCLIISSLCLLYIFYRAEIYWDGKKVNYYNIYYIFSFILILFSILTFFLNYKIKEYLIISLFSILFGLYLIEFYIYKNNEKYKSVLNKNRKVANQGIDTKNKFEVYLDLKKSNKNVKIDVSPSNFIPYKTTIPLPLSGHSNSETVFCNENGYYAIYDSDRYGFNNPDNQWDQNQVEYLLIGDSFVHGACVNRPHDIASSLRTISNKTALSLGYSGNGPLIEYATLKEFLKPNIKKILWFYYEGNDLWDLDFEKNNIILQKYLKNSNFTQNIKSYQKDIDILIDDKINKEISEKSDLKKNEINILNIIKMYELRGFIYRLIAEKRNIELFKEILKDSKKISIKNNSKLYFIYLPDYTRYVSNSYKSSYDSIKKVINELDIKFIDIHEEVFKKEKEPLKLFPFEKPGHYTPEGYKKVATTVFKLTSD